jgi:hypothetical protein
VGRAKREFAQGKKSYYCTLRNKCQNYQGVRPEGRDMYPGLPLIHNRHTNNADFEAEQEERFLERAAYTLAQSKEIAKRGQRSLHDYFDQNAPKPTKEYIKNTEESMITRRRQTQTKISVRYIS